jgi:hypothetical protein
MAIDELQTEVERARSAAGHSDLSNGLPTDELRAIATRLLAGIERYSLPASAYRREAERVEGWDGARVLAFGGILAGLKADLVAGYLASVEQLVHADVFSDFLEMAVELLDKGYKDPAAVVAGSVLEEHIRKLAAQSGIETEDDEGKPVKTDRLNAALARTDVYNKLEQKSVTAWLDLRNTAAHGGYDGYDHRQVAALIGSVRDFLVRHPA